MNETHVIDAIRSQVGRFSGSLPGVRPDDLAVHVVRALMERSRPERHLP